MNKTKYQNKIAICIPVFNDWDTVLLLLNKIDTELGLLCSDLEIVLIDDGSTIDYIIGDLLFQNISKIRSVKLRRNMGHQRAIAVGLAYINDKIKCEFVIVMDGDGEDKVEDIERLVDDCIKMKSSKVIFARRIKRVEGIAFKIFYKIYKLIHFVLIGKKIEVGNFSVIPISLLQRIVGVSELWNHYAASVFNAKLPTRKVNVNRGRRLSGKSKMGFTALVIHGLRAFSVYSEVIAVRLVVFLALILFVLFLMVSYYLVSLFLPQINLPGSFAVGLLLGIIWLSSLLAITLFFLLSIFQSRSILGFIPMRDWVYFVSEDIVFYER